jgi:hypothetical protein
VVEDASESYDTLKFLSSVVERAYKGIAIRPEL